MSHRHQAVSCVPFESPDDAREFPYCTDCERHEPILIRPLRDCNIYEIRILIQIGDLNLVGDLIFSNKTTAVLLRLPQLNMQTKISLLAPLPKAIETQIRTQIVKMPKRSYFPHHVLSHFSLSFIISSLFLSRLVLIWFNLKTRPVFSSLPSLPHQRHFSTNNGAVLGRFLSLSFNLFEIKQKERAKGNAQRDRETERTHQSNDRVDRIHPHSDPSDWLFLGREPGP